jgi:hypothetical protein
MDNLDELLRVKGEEVASKGNDEPFFAEEPQEPGLIAKTDTEKVERTSLLGVGGCNGWSPKKGKYNV